MLFQPQGDDANVTASYRGFISFGPKTIVLDPNTGATELLLEYDAAGGTNFVPLPWCGTPQFDETGQVIVGSGADVTTVPTGDTWCIASEATVGQDTDSAVTTWQVFGQDDPNFK